MARPAKPRATSGGSASSGGATGLHGYLYQRDVSVWLALDLVLAKGLATEVALEPAESQEDLEAVLAEDDPGPVATTAVVAGYRMVMQSKRRSTGSWTPAALKRVISKSGPNRVSALQRLKSDPAVRYLFVTDAGLQGDATGFSVTEPGAWASKLPKGASAWLPASAAGRVAVLSTWDDYKLDRKLKELIEEALRVPLANREACLDELRRHALTRMVRQGHGAWTRPEIEQVIRAFGGRIATTADADEFVKPTCWEEMRSKLRAENAIIITGPSGTGKTSAAEALLDDLGRDGPAPLPVRVDGGPGLVRGERREGPIAFLIEDPWGKYRLGPEAGPWNDELVGVLSTRSPNRRFIITSRSDVLDDNTAKPRLSKRMTATLEAEHYGPSQRQRLFNAKLRKLTPGLQQLAEQGRGQALKELSTPLELQSFFDAIGEERDAKVPEHRFVDGCVAQAQRDALEVVVYRLVGERDAWKWAAVLWGLLKARPRLSREALPAIADALAEQDPIYLDGLERFANFLVSGHRLRQSGSILTYAHPRVEAGLERAVRDKRQTASVVLGDLIQALCAMDTDGGDWGVESAAHVTRAALNLEKFNFRRPAAVQGRLDEWAATQLLPADGFGERLQIAGDIGSPSSMPAEVARWLLHRGPKAVWFNVTWTQPDRENDWYRVAAMHPQTPEIVERFVVEVLPFRNHRYPRDFSARLQALHPYVTPAFLRAAEAIVHEGYNSIAEAIAAGALEDLQGFERVAELAIAARDRDSDDPKAWLRYENGEYDADYGEYLGDQFAEVGHTAGVLLDAYVERLRADEQWARLNGSPLAIGLTPNWIGSLTRSPGATDEEVQAVAALAIGGPHEHSLWEMLEADWRPCMEHALLQRLMNGSAVGDIRVAALRSAAIHAPAIGEEAVVHIVVLEQIERLFRFVLDCRNAVADGSQVCAIQALYQRILVHVPAGLREAVNGIWSDTPILSSEGLSALDRAARPSDPDLRLLLARWQGRAGGDVGEELDLLLRLPASERSHIERAVSATQLLADRDDIARLRTALQHPFADVRQLALETLVELADETLLPEVLTLVNDPGSRVRLSLLGYLDPSVSAGRAALVSLIDDTWSGSSSYYNESVRHDIARQAAQRLIKADLTADQVNALLERARVTEDHELRGLLCDAAVCAGGPYGRRQVLDIALATGQRLRFPLAAAWALLRGPTIESGAADEIDAAKLIHRAPSVAVLLALILGSFGSSERIMAAGSALSAYSDRRALIVPLRQLVSDAAVRAALGRFLPDILAEGLDAAEQGTTLPRNVLDTLGLAPVVTAVLEGLSYLFEKPTRHNPRSR